MSTRRDFLKYSAAASASGLLPFSMKAPAAVKSGSSLSVAIVADPLPFDPHLAGNLQGRATTQAIHDTLLTVDKDGRLAPLGVVSGDLVVTTRQSPPESFYASSSGGTHPQTSTNASGSAPDPRRKPASSHPPRVSR